MTWDDVAAVLDAGGALDHRLAQVTKHSSGADQQAEGHRLWQAQLEETRKGHGRHDRAKGSARQPLPGLRWADMWYQLMPADGAAHQVSAGVAGSGPYDDYQQPGGTAAAHLPLR